MQVILCALAPYASLREKELPAEGWVGHTSKGVKRFFFEKNFGRKKHNPYFCIPDCKTGHRIDPWCNGNTTDFGSVI
jgi:hypothetical protein